jgi:hypothetical protein
VAATKVLVRRDGRAMPPARSPSLAECSLLDGRMMRLVKEQTGKMIGVFNGAKRVQKLRVAKDPDARVTDLSSKLGVSPEELQSHADFLEELLKAGTRRLFSRTLFSTAHLFYCNTAEDNLTDMCGARVHGRWVQTKSSWGNGIPQPIW